MKNTHPFPHIMHLHNGTCQTPGCAFAYIKRIWQKLKLFLMNRADVSKEFNTFLITFYCRPNLLLKTIFETEYGCNS